MYDDEMMDAMFEETMDYSDDKVFQEWVEFQRGDYDDAYDPYEDLKAYI